MEKIGQCIKKRKLIKKLKKLKSQKKAMLSLVHDGSWKKNDPFFLQLYSENNQEIDEVRIELNKI